MYRYGAIAFVSDRIINQNNDDIEQIVLIDTILKSLKRMGHNFV